MRRLQLGLLAVLAAALGLFAQGLPRLKPGFNLFSPQQDVELGKQAAAEISQQYMIVKDPALSNYVQSIGRKLTSQKQAGDYPYSFTVVHDPTINAFALPGGPAFVHTTLLLAADNEAQVAGVLAHEISHVALRHGTNQATKANMIQIPAALAAAAAGKGSMLGQLTQLGIGFGANSVLLKYSRNAERDADLLGAQIMAGAGYNPVEMARFFEKLEAEGGSRIPQFLSDHPNPGNRIKAIEAMLPYLPQRTYRNEVVGGLAQAQAKVRALGPAPQRKAAK